MAAALARRTLAGVARLATRTTAMKLRVATYNVHRCRGMDRRVRPQRIVEVLGEINADIIALQEVLSIADRKPEDDQAHFIAEQLKLSHTVGGTRRLRGGLYGNVVLS